MKATAITIALWLGLASAIVATLVASARADDDPSSSCCVCDCSGDAPKPAVGATSTLAAPIACVDTEDSGLCFQLCGDLGCRATEAANVSCNQFAACPDAETMAPVASLAGLFAVCTALAGLGYRRVRN